MKDNNELLHEIATELDDKTPKGVKSDNYWLHKIADGVKDINPEVIIDGDKIDLKDYVKKSDIDTEELTFKFADDSTETITFLVQSGD